MKKQGFTLVELLAVITILGLLGLILVPSVDGLIRNSRKKVYKKQKEAILTSLQDFLTDNRDLFYEIDSLTITLGDLKEQNYIDYDVRDPQTNKCVSNNLALTITKVDKTFEYTIVGNELVTGKDEECDATERLPSIYLVGNNPMSLEINTTYVEPGYTAKNINGDDITSSVKRTNNINSAKLGTYNVNYQVTSGGLTKTKARTVNVVDTTAPEIIIPEDTVIYTNVTTFDIMEDVTISDNSGVAPSVLTNSDLSLGVIGEYEVVYVATDASGNSTTKVRKIKVEQTSISLKLYTSDTSTTDDFHSETYRSNIKNVFLIKNMTVPSNAVETWDLSLNEDGSIKGWIVLNSSDSSMYDLYIGSNGRILANADSSYLFNGLTKAETIEFSNFLTEGVTKMNYMFKSCESLVDLDVSFFDTSQAINMSGMFRDCSKLTRLDVSNFNTSNAKQVDWMFAGCKSLTSLDVSNFDTSNVTNMAYMFNACAKLTAIDVSNFNTSYADITGLFSECSSLLSLDLSNFNTSRSTNMMKVFKDCSSLTALDLSSFDTSNVTAMSAMFQNCSSLKTLDLDNFNTSKVTQMNFMFSDCRSLTKLDLRHFDVSKVTSFEFAFNNCSSLTSLDVSTFVTSSLNNMNYMFYNCSSLTSLDVSKFVTTKVWGMRYTFYNCRLLTKLDLSSFVTSTLKGMENIFAHCNSLVDLNISNFDTTYVTNMSGAFMNCISLKSLDLSHFKTPNLETMTALFQGCTGLTSLNVSSFDTSKVTSMKLTFHSLHGLTELDISNFTLANGVDVAGIFQYNITIKVIYVGPNFEEQLANALNADKMFISCEGISSVTVKS